MAKIFLVEDDSTTQIIVKTMLNKEGHEVTVFDSGNDVVRTFRQSRPDMLITDLVMDGKEGMQLITEIKELDENIPVIVMSSHIDYLEMSEAFDVSATLLKPIEKDRLIETVNGLL